MECAKSLELLSDFHDNALDETLRVEVRTHLDECRPCAGVFRDLDTIVLAATVLRSEPGVAFPDEQLIWQRMSIGNGPVH
ncbi:MAG TPA: zf-HC2 domain-containing protein [Pyrinomonadaceae bacterium]|nr:zf-HC2 domain-containing protein [Pyrinomonadaceae bacterium]